ncbi:hypothetical protein [Streptomyces sp. NBC_00347]|nr:hypothetical protein [Streptomyces sp. NBC_00347]MCX5126364.1 hypothetical protein [Streptomyces sp. NBC_00347]
MGAQPTSRFFVCRESGDAAGASMGAGLENLDDKEANVRANAKELSSGG